MPTAEMRDEEKWKLPADTLLPARLTSVEISTIEYTNKKTGKPDSFTKWTWEFEIGDGLYAGLRAWGDSEDRLTNHPDNKVRQWAETLRGKEFELGEGLNTDDLLGLPCVISVDNTEYIKKDGTVSYLSPVSDVFPADSFTDEPPF